VASKRANNINVPDKREWKVKPDHRTKEKEREVLRDKLVLLLGRTRGRGLGLDRVCEYYSNCFLL